ncbi:glycosyltransferase family 4 protein, partial [Candidatus Aerophobetes bacterium]|nr:glycosyltransferase family 4 protein [Candidatus Aerophobetes bacterium]
CESKKCTNCLGFWGNFVWLRKYIFSLFLKLIDKFVVLSKNSKEILIDNGIEEEKIEIRRIKVKMGRCKGGKRGVILYVGWLVPHKGLHILIKALAGIEKDFKLIIVGDTDIDKRYFNYIKRLIKEEGMEDKVLFLGKKKHEEMEKVYSLADVVAIPELWENVSPLVLLESLKLGKNIIASKIGGIPEILRNRGFLVEAGNVEEWKKVLEVFL